MTDDEVVAEVEKQGGTARWLRGRRTNVGPTEGQLKRLVREGRLRGATVTYAPWDGPPKKIETVPTYTSVYATRDGVEVVGFDNIPRNPDGTRDQRYRYKESRKTGTRKRPVGAVSSLAGGVWLEVQLP